MKKLLVKYASEITLKGLNRKSFEDLLIKNIKERIGKNHKITKDLGRVFIEDYEDEMIDKLIKVFGVQSVAVADVVEKEIRTIGEAAVLQLKDIDVKTFKVECKRADKSSL